MTIRGMLREEYWYSGDPEPQIASLSAFCPGCGFEHSFNVDLVGHGRWREGGALWEFNGDYEKPTFRPSMFHNRDGNIANHPLCHSWVTDGQWEFLVDSTHSLAGQTVDMVHPDPEMGFRRRHGWHLINPDDPANWDC